MVFWRKGDDERLSRFVARALWHNLPHLPRSTFCWAFLSVHQRHQPSSYQHLKSIMSNAADQPKKERFAPKEAVTLQPPKDDIIDRDHLAKCDGMLG
jgi:hypothetical protein